MTTSEKGITWGELGLDSAVQVSTTEQHISPDEVTETASSASAQKLYDILQGLLTTFSPEHSLDEMLRCLATFIPHPTSMDLCAFILLESANGHITMHTS